MELARESRLVGVAAFLCDDTNWITRLAQPIAGKFYPRPCQVLTSREAEQSPDALIELEHRQLRPRREIGESQRCVEMVLDMAEHGREPRHIRFVGSPTSLRRAKCRRAR